MGADMVPVWASNFTMLLMSFFALIWIGLLVYGLIDLVNWMRRKGRRQR